MRVVVTRPEQDAGAWLRALSERGHEVLALPLMAIAPARDMEALRQSWRDIDRYRAVMFVSGNAVQGFCAAQLPPTLQDWAQRAPQTRAWGTGPGTRAALVRAGVEAQQIDAPQSGQFDSEALWAIVQGSVRPGQRVLIARGADAGQVCAEAGSGRDWLAQRLCSAGAEVDFAVAYERRAPELSERQRELLQCAAGDASLWLFSSSQSIANLMALATGVDWRGARALATHPRIAQAARAAGFGAVLESRPSLAEVLASIESQA